MPLPQFDYSRLTHEQLVIELESKFVKWQVWIVNRYIGGPVYCARLWEDHKTVINAYGPNELVESIEEYETEQEKYK